MNHFLFKKGILFALLITGLLLLSYHNIHSLENPKYKGTFRIKSFSKEFTGELDPIDPDSYIFISEQLFDGLVRLDRNYNIVPSLAEYWKISRDGKKYIFYLRKGVNFHHGHELSASDVKYSLERILDRKMNSPYFQFFLHKVEGGYEFYEGKAKHVSGFRVLDKHTFEIDWTKPFVSALYLLSMHFCKILPKALLQKQGKRFFYKPSGTGPFQFDYWLRTPKLKIVGVRLKRNNSYFKGKPYLNAVEFSPNFSIDHFINGEIELTPVISERLDKPSYNIVHGSSLKPVFIGMSCHIYPLNIREIRKAVSYVIHKENLVSAASDVRYSYEITNNFIPSRLPGFFPKDAQNDYNIEKARQIFNERGLLSEKKFPVLTLFIELPKNELKFNLFKELKKQLEVLGIKLKLRFYNSTEDIRRSESPYLVLLGRLMNIPDPEDIIKPLFYSKSVFNIFGYLNPELDILLKKAEIERSWTKKIHYFRKIEDILYFDVPAIPAYYQRNRIAVQPWVKGIEIPAMGIYYLEARKIWMDN
ncbi:MAG: ABC transporter substrate-binding protein [Candidatus Aminicenantaceae bacterium]